MTVRGSIFSLRSTGFRLQVVAGGTFVCIQVSISLCYLRVVFLETRRPRIPDAYSPSYETSMTPPGAFVCWTDLVESPATRMTSRSPVSPSRFSMRQEICLPFNWYAKRLGTRPLSTLRSSPTEQRPENVVPGSPSDRITTSGLPPGSSPRVISGGGDSRVVSSPVVGADVVSSLTFVLFLAGLLFSSG